MKTDSIMQTLHTDELILSAIREDIPWEDVSANAVVEKDARGYVELLAKQDGVIAGLEVFARTFELLDETAQCEFSVKDGDEVKRGQKLGTIRAKMRALLSGDRTALNFLGRMSGIASYTHQVAKLLEGTHTKLLDTRKTTPGLRVLEKYAVRMGGGNNHRFGLSDGVLLKDNHIGAAGSVCAAIERARAYAPFVRKIEIEVETIAQLEEALDAGADIVMLDNMDGATLQQAVKLAKGRAETEISGNVTKENVAQYVSYGVDYISSGALTHSAPVLDLSLKNLRPEQ